ncbi:vera protein [Nemania sp. FL0031]|nr:vera protein [Nemania sp. FL0031]
MLGVSGSLLSAVIAVAITYIAAAITAVVGHFVYQGYIHRSRVRSLKAQGLPILPHSLILGHLLVLADFTRLHPPDVNIHVFHTWLAENCQKYFPGHERPPPVVYLDLWPVSNSLAIVNDPVVASQFTIAKNLPKVGMVKQYIKPLTSSIDIFCTEGLAWKTWRSILNPGFSNRNLMTMVPEIIEEVTVFVKELKKTSGPNGTWGSVFQLEQKTTNLTFDVICRAIVDMRLRQQSSASDTPLKTALLDQLRLMGIMTNAARATLLGRMPWHTAAIANNNRVMRNILLPQIQAKLEEEVNHAQRKTIVDLAVESFHKADRQAARGKQSGFVETLIANLKIFLFAGHDTTSSSICFMFKLLQDNPQTLATLRKEHDDVLGPDPEKAAQVLTVSPQLLSSLPYTLGVIKETLRLHPLAGTIRECAPDFYLTDDSNTQYPMDGFGAWMSAPAIHRHPKYWPRPDEFVPERWTVAEGDPLHPVHNAWVPFSIGARNCIGMELAMIELKLVLVLLARTFDIEEAWDEWDTERGPKATPAHAVNGQRLYAVGISTVHPKDGMPVRVRERKHGVSI